MLRSNKWSLKWDQSHHSTLIRFKNIWKKHAGGCKKTPCTYWLLFFVWMSVVMQQPLPIGFAVPRKSFHFIFINIKSIIYWMEIIFCLNFLDQMITPLGPTSINTNCPHCHAQIDTTVVSRPSIWAYMSSTVLALIGSLFEMF